MYHKVSLDESNPGKVKRELADIRAHGGTLIYPLVDVRFSLAESGQVKASYEDVGNGLRILREAGFEGPVPIGTGLPALQNLLGLKTLELTTNVRFLVEARAAIQGLKAMQAEFPGLEIALTHLDEVFGHQRLPRYIALTKAARQVPGFRFYITFHTVSEEAESLRKEIDPYVEIRGNHGYSLEWWLARGHTAEEYEEELRASGDEAWFYLNPNRVWRDAMFQRLMNGLYMWVTPFSGRLDWRYSAPKGDPFDDLDDKGTDVGYAFWSLSEPGKLVPTREWEAWREGIDDVRYLLMLQGLVEQRPDTAAARAAARWLAELRNSLPKPQGLSYSAGPTARRDASESPFILALRQKFSADDLQRMGYDAARHIQAMLGMKGL